MAVWCRQSYDGLKSGADYLIAPVADESDRDLLNRKADSHGGKGWTVVWSGLDSFTATKVRSLEAGSDPVSCERYFFQVA